jgi:hypothetical protein
MEYHGKQKYTMIWSYRYLKRGVALPLLHRREIRRIFEERFTARRMADDYVDIYRELRETLSRR